MSRAMVGMIDRGELCGVRSDDGRQSRGWRSGLAGTQLASTQRENRLRDSSASGWAPPDGQRPHSAEDDPDRTVSYPQANRSTTGSAGADDAPTRGCSDCPATAAEQGREKFGDMA